MVIFPQPLKWKTNPKPTKKKINPGCSGTWDPPASASQVLGLQLCIPGFQFLL
jgi:hypothetical protein